MENLIENEYDKNDFYNNYFKQYSNTSNTTNNYHYTGEWEKQRDEMLNPYSYTTQNFYINSNSSYGNNFKTNVLANAYLNKYENKYAKK